MDTRLLLIDDDPAVRDLAALVLGEAGFAVDVAADVAVPETVPWDRYHVVVLDIGLPSIDGIELCRGIRRRSAVPVLMLTGRDGNDDVVAGLDAGADDYVTKPFVPEVLVARARAAARRQVPGTGSVRLVVGDLVVDERAGRAFRGGVELDLTSTEMRLLVVLARNAGSVMGRDRLLSEVWGYDYLGDSRLVDMGVQRLRAKLRSAATAGEHVGASAEAAAASAGSDHEPLADPIVTVRGAGYRLDG
jgi:two-component system, OmpR family, response regulator MtrA